MSDKSAQEELIKLRSWNDKLLAERQDLRTQLAALQQQLETSRRLLSDAATEAYEADEKLAALQQRCARKDEALREAIEHLDAKILGKSILGYLHEQFPATVGHIPLHDYCCGLGATLVACSAALAPDAGTGAAEGAAKP